MKTHTGAPIAKTANALVQSCFRAGRRVLDFAILLAIGVAIQEHDKTLGEERVGIGFNESGDNAVSQIKRLAVDFIDRVNAIEPGAVGCQGGDPDEGGRTMSAKPRPADPCCRLGYSPSDPRQSTAEGKVCAHAERLLNMVHAYCQIRDSWTGWVRGRSMRVVKRRTATP